MKKADVKIGETYTAKVSNKLAKLRITGVSPYGGWDAINVATGHEVRVRSAQRLRSQVPTAPQRLFIGIFPTGISYADRTREEHGDYVRLAFLSFKTLSLQVNSKTCPHDLAVEINRHADTIKARRGQSFQISTCGQTVTLGE